MANTWGDSTRHKVKRCRECGTEGLITITMRFEDTPIEVEACQACETRRWTSEGEPVDLKGLLPALRKQVRRRL